MTPTDGPEPGPKTEETKQNAADNLDVSEQTLVNINAYKVDLSDAHIYKYVIKFSPVDYFSDKEKKKLAECFLGSLLLDLNPVDTVIGDDFEFFLPHPHAQLMQKYLQVPFARSDSRKEPYLEVKSFAPGGNQPVYSTFSPLTELCDKGPCGDVAISVPRVFEGLNICEVSAHRPQFILKNLLASKDSGSKSPVLAAVTKIFQRNATPTVSWHNEGKVAAVKGLREMGSKVFDFLELSNEEPVHIGSGFVVRRGINASTQIIAGSIFRVVSPTHGMFFEAGINLAELVVRFVGTAKLDEAKRGLLKKLLKGMTIIKAYGGKGMRHIVDLGDLPGEVKFVWGEHGRCTVERYMEEAYNHKIHDDYARLPCIKVFNSSISEYLPMSVCVVATGQRVQLSLLEEMKVLSKAESEVIKGKVRSSARQMRDAQSDYGRKFLSESMSSQTLVAFNIKISNISDDESTIAQIEGQVKTPASIDAKLLTRVPRASEGALSSRLSGASVMVYLFMQTTPNGFQSIVPRLFDAYGVQLKEVKMMSGAPRREKLRKLTEQSRDDKSIVFGIWSKAHNVNYAVREAYQTTRSLCNEEGMAEVSVADLGVSLGRPADINRIGSALHKLLARREFLALNADAADSDDSSDSVLLAIYVSALPDPQSKKRLPNVKSGEPEESNARCQRRKKSLARSFLVTFALSDGKPSSFCRTKTVLQIWENPESDGVSQQTESRTYPGVHELDEANLKIIFSFLDANIKAYQQVDVFRAGVRPSEHAAEPGQQNKAEVAFWKDWATRCHLDLSYHTVSSSSRLNLSNVVHRETPAPAGSTNGDYTVQPTSDVTLLVEPSFPGANQWLLQKQTAKGPQPRALSLAAHLGAERRVGFDAMVSAAAWNFPPSTWSAKELAPVFLARKATRAIVRKFNAEAKVGPAGPDDYSAEKLKKIQDEVKYPIYLD